MEVIKINNVSKNYKLYSSKNDVLKDLLLGKSKNKEFKALNKINYSFEHGKTYGIIGRNGSGKTTLLKIISGIIMPSCGDVLINGKISFLNINVGLDSEFTGRENIYFKGILMGLSKDFIKSKIDEIIEFSELDFYIDQPVKTYSSGMKSKLGFAISVIVEPDILVIDEALAVGDAKFKKKCKNKINDFKLENKTIIYVSHDSNSVKNFCEEVLWLEKGNLISSGKSESVVKLYNDYNSNKISLDEIKKLVDKK